MYHKPVLLHESVEGLQVQPDGLYADVTFGGGGHSSAILELLGTNGKLFGFDQDEDAKANVINDPRFVFIPQNFQFLKNFVRLYGVRQLDGVLADLGVSSHQFDVPDKGFSTRFDGRLDMRMDQQQEITAETIVNTFDQQELTDIFRKYGELQQAWQMAGAVVASRQNAPIRTTNELKQVVAPFLARNRENKVLAQLFQALRIEVNQEMQVLEKFLDQCADVIKPGGRLVVISYHSLEDRLVKNFMRAGKASGVVEKDFYGRKLSPWEVISRKPILATADEVKENSRARSAKLRIAQRKADD